MLKGSRSSSFAERNRFALFPRPRRRIRHPAAHVPGRGTGVAVGGLVVGEEIRLELPQEGPFFPAAEEHGFIHLDGHESVVEDRRLMRPVHRVHRGGKGDRRGG